nr:unknown [Ipomoea trifida]
MLLTSSSLYLCEVPVLPFDMLHEGNWIVKTFTASRADVNCRICNALPFVDVMDMIHEVHNRGESHAALWALFYVSTGTPTRIPSLSCGSAVKAAPVFSFLQCLIELGAQFCHSSSSFCPNRRCCPEESGGPARGRSSGRKVILSEILMGTMGYMEVCKVPSDSNRSLHSRPSSNLTFSFFFSVLQLDVYTLCLKPKSKREERVIVRISNIHGELINSLEPCPRKLAREPVITKKHVCNALAFGSWKPSSHKGINLREPSAYVVSPTTTMAWENSFDFTYSTSGFSLKATSVFGSTVALIADSIVVPVVQSTKGTPREFAGISPCNPGMISVIALTISGSSLFRSHELIYRNAGCKYVLNPSSPDFKSSCSANPPNQLRIPECSTDMAI